MGDSALAAIARIAQVVNRAEEMKRQLLEERVGGAQQGESRTKRLTTQSK